MAKTTNEKKVIVYSTPTCVFCHAVKDFFGEHKISYEEFNVASDIARRKEMVDKSGQLGVPVIDIGGEIIIGFDEPRLTKLLGL